MSLISKTFNKHILYTLFNIHDDIIFNIIVLMVLFKIIVLLFVFISYHQ